MTIGKVKGDFMKNFMMIVLVSGLVSTALAQSSQQLLLLPVLGEKNTNEDQLPIYDDHDVTVPHSHELFPEIYQGNSVSLENGETLNDELSAAQITVKDWVIKGLQKTTSVFADAYHATSNQTWKDIFSKGWNKSKVVSVHWPNPGYDFRNCDPLTLAYTYVNGSDIYLCRRVIDDKNFQLLELTQTLVHEVGHDIGYRNECDTTRIEVSAVRLTIGLQYKNGYWGECGIQ
jgi:hypothetical protein